MGKYVCVLAGLLLCCGIGRADDSPIYAVSGDLTLTGNNACGGPCVDTIDFSFELTQIPSESLPSPSGLSWALPAYSVVSVSTTGPLAFLSYSIGAANLELRDDCQGYVPFDDSAQDEFDVCVAYPSAAGNPPVVEYSELYSCQTETCFTDFDTDRFASGPPDYAIGLEATGLVTVTELTLEPGVATLLLFGLAGLWIVGAVARGGKISSRRTALD